MGRKGPTPSFTPAPESVKTVPPIKKLDPQAALEQCLLDDRAALKARLEKLFKQWPKIYAKQAALEAKSPEKLDAVLDKLRQRGSKIDTSTI